MLTVSLELVLGHGAVFILMPAFPLILLSVYLT